MSCRYRRHDGPGPRLPKSGQSSIEFVLIFSLLLAILAIGATAAWVKIYGVSEANKELEINKVLDETSGKINLAFLEGDGFSIGLKVPQNIFGQNFTINIYNNNIVIYFANSTYSKSLLTENITGVMKKGQNTIKNRAGEILIT
jgi:hypothetical protein